MRFVLCLICSLAAFLPGATQVLAQSVSPMDEPQFQAPQTYQSPQATQASEASDAPQPPMSADDPRLLLMVRNAIIALNQANLTGNYSVLRDMGTPNFQMTNSSARLAEAFAGLRARRIDISPIMFFNPKFASPPSMQDGQVLRVAGLFPTTPEQVNFDLAFQMLGEQWMIAAIAVNVAPPGENFQANAGAHLPQRIAETADVKPVRIDLSQPASTSPQQTAAKKASRKPKPHPQKTAAAQPGEPQQQQPQQVPGPGPAPSSPDGAAWPFGR